MLEKGFNIKIALENNRFEELSKNKERVIYK